MVFSFTPVRDVSQVEKHSSSETLGGIGKTVKCEFGLCVFVHFIKVQLPTSCNNNFHMADDLFDIGWLHEDTL